jgi:predicted TIM-barrel fold metal-dependent hydrolase
MSEEWVIDADGHVIESDQQLLAYLPPPYTGQDQMLSYPFFPTLDGWHRTARRITDPKGVHHERPTASDWLVFLDQAHIAATVLFPTAGLAFGLIADPEWATALARGYNDWLYDRFLKANPSRLYGIALIPVQDPSEAARELRRAVSELGMVGAVLPAVGLARAYGAPEFRPIYEAAQELDVMLAVHGAPSHNLGLERFQRLIEVRTLTHPLSQMIQLTSMMFGGVFDRFPRLRVAYCEAGACWVPMIAERMDREYGARSTQAPDLKQRPSEHLRSGRIFVHCELDELGLVDALKWLPDDAFFCASDYPHELKEEFPASLEEFRQRPDIPLAAKRKILWDNPLRLYRLDSAVLSATRGESAVALAE